MRSSSARPRSWGYQERRRSYISRSKGRDQGGSQRKRLRVSPRSRHWLVHWGGLLWLAFAIRRALYTYYIFWISDYDFRRKERSVVLFLSVADSEALAFSVSASSVPRQLMKRHKEYDHLVRRDWRRLLTHVAGSNSGSRLSPRSGKTGPKDYPLGNITGGAMKYAWQRILRIIEVWKSRESLGVGNFRFSLINGGLEVGAVHHLQA